MQPSTFIYFTNLSDVCVIFSCHTGIVKLVYSSSVCVYLSLCVTLIKSEVFLIASTLHGIISIVHTQTHTGVIEHFSSILYVTGSNPGAQCHTNRLTLHCFLSIFKFMQMRQSKRWMSLFVFGGRTFLSPPAKPVSHWNSRKCRFIKPAAITGGKVDIFSFIWSD